ncbi:hypothetical protein ONZ45_g17598 [Pleurotus djamor]|nr:hypothetical protein ONZ45_g17598 [Pleurotus djamor]
MGAAIAELTLSQPNLCSSSNVFTLFIDSLEHKPQLHRPPPLSKPETYTLGADQRPKSAPLRGSRNYTPPDVNAVLLEEALLLDVQRRVQSFYQRQATQVLERVKATKTSPSTPSPPAPDNFMLYRKPPSWESLFESSTRASFAEPGGAVTTLSTESRHRTPLDAKSAVQSKAMVNPRKANEMKAALLANWDSTSRTILNSQTGKQSGPSARPFTPTTRNPFAKQFVGSRTGTDDAQRRHSLPSRPYGTSTLRPPPVPLRDSPRALAVSSAPTPPKQLKPVSTLPVPLRPQASSSAQKETVARKINKPHRLIATGTDGFSENGARSNNRRISQDKDSLYAQIDDTLVRYSDRRVEVENTSSSAKRLRLRADDPLPPKSTTKSASTVAAPASKGFNWKGWGNKK